MSGRLVPMRHFDWSFFDRQKDLFPKFPELSSDFNLDFKRFDEELERMRKDMFKLTPFDFGSDLDSMFLKVDQPFAEDIKGNKRLSLRFDCSQFKPEEIQIRTMDNVLSVEAKHTEVSPGRKVYREFKKSYTLPKTVDPLKVTSTLTKDGVLNIEAPAPLSVEARKERLIPIEML